MNIWVNRRNNLIEQYGNSNGVSDDTYEVISGITFSFLKGHNYAYINGTIVVLPAKPSHQHEYVDGAWVEAIRVIPFYENRINEYPSMAEQLDMLYHAMDSGEIPKAEIWYNTIKDVKIKYPKKEK